MGDNLNIHVLDIVIVCLYLIGITVLGVWTSRHVKSLSDFFMPRRFGTGMMTMHSFGTGTASDQAVTVAAATYQHGLSGIWYQWVWLFVTPFYWIIAPVFRRFRAITTADVYELRFGRSVAVLFSIIGIAGLCVKIGLMLKGASALIEGSTGSLVSTNIAIPVLTLMFVTYGVAGGLGAAIVTDYIQGVMTIVFSFMLLPFVLGAVGGISGIRQTMADPQMISLVAPDKITLFWLVMMGIQALVGIVAQPFVMGICAAGRTEWEGRMGLMGGNLLKRVCTAAWCLTGIGALAWYVQQGVDPSAVDPDQIYGLVAQHFLPSIMTGLLGLFVASLLAGVMSSCDSFMISSAGLFTENIYRPLRPNESMRHYLSVGRVASICVVGGGVLFAYVVPNVVKALEIWFMIAPMMGLAFWIGLIWRGMTSAGAWATAIVGFGTWWLLTRDWCVDWLANTSVADQLSLIATDGESKHIHMPWLIVGYMVAATVIGVLVSVITRKRDSEKLVQFYQLVSTPVLGPEEIEAPCNLPKGMAAWAELPVSRFGLFLPRPSVVTVVGFLFGCVGVAALIGGFVLILNL